MVQKHGDNIIEVPSQAHLEQKCDGCGNTIPPEEPIYVYNVQDALKMEMLCKSCTTAKEL